MRKACAREYADGCAAMSGEAREGAPSAKRASARDAECGRRAADGSSERERGSSFVLAVRPFERLRGMALAKDGDDAVLIAPCKDVHTVGMRTDLDIAFVDERGVVMEVCRNVAPRSRCRCPGAVGVVERRSRAGSWLTRGDRLALARFCAHAHAPTDDAVRLIEEKGGIA